MNLGICPDCNGSCRVSAGHLKYKDQIRNYNEKDDTLPCWNCGGQTMSGIATGKVLLRNDGSPCHHQYETVVLGNCWRKYVCKHCKDEHEIDSSG